MAKRMINIQHITLNDITQQVDSVTKNEVTAVSKEVCLMTKTLACLLYPNIVLKKKSAN